MNRKHLSLDAAAYAFGGAFFVLLVGLLAFAGIGLVEIIRSLPWF